MGADLRLIMPKKEQGGTELTMLDSLIMTPFNPARVEHELRGYLADWPSLAQAHPARTRQILRKLLPSRIRVWRVLRECEKSYHFEGEAAVGRLLNGLMNIERSGVPNGSISLFPPCLEGLIVSFSGVAA